MRPNRSTAAFAAASRPRVGDVQRDGQQVVVCPDGLEHPVRIASGRDDGVSCGQGLLAISMPSPRPAPVMNQTLLMSVSISEHCIYRIRESTPGWYYLHGLRNRIYECAGTT